MSIHSELGHLARSIILLAYGKKQMVQASFEHGTSRSRVLRSAVAPHWLGMADMVIIFLISVCTPLSSEGQTKYVLVLL